QQRGIPYDNKPKTSTEPTDTCELLTRVIGRRIEKPKGRPCDLCERESQSQWPPTSLSSVTRSLTPIKGTYAGEGTLNARYAVDAQVKNSAPMPRMKVGARHNLPLGGGQSPFLWCQIRPLLDVSLSRLETNRIN
ncbi:hypothetical protein LSAT2_024441, partial [Lamellibrachia satsuma]